MQKPKLVYITYIRSTPKDVWAAITKPEFTRKYWGEMTNVSDWKTRLEMGTPQSRERSLDHRQSVGEQSTQAPRAVLGRPGRSRGQIARHV